MLDRRKFLNWLSLIFVARLNILSVKTMDPQQFLFKDDGKIPNSRFPFADL